MLSLLALLLIAPFVLYDARPSCARPSGICIDLQDRWFYNYAEPYDLKIVNARDEWGRIRLNCRVFNGAHIKVDDDYLCKHFRVYVDDEPCSVIGIRRLR